MKNIALVLVAFMLTAMTGCIIEEDDVPNPSDPRDKFLGTWKVNEDCTRSNYTVNITRDPGNSLQVLIDNFGNPGPGYDPAVGLVVSNTIKVSSQNIGEGWTVSGEGIYLSNGTINWSYTLIISGSKENCSAVYSR